MRSVVLATALTASAAYHFNDPASWLIGAGALVLFLGLLSEPVGVGPRATSLPLAVRLLLSIGGLALIVVGALQI